MINNYDFKDKLKEFDLSKRESTIVLFLFRNSPSSISQISENVNIPRSSIYRYVSKLEKKGWVKYALTRKGKLVELTNLRSLKGEMKMKKNMLNKKSKFLDDFINQIAENETSQNPQLVKYYEGKIGMRQIQWNASFKSEGKVRVFTNLITRNLIGDTFYNTNLKEVAKRNIPIEILVDRNYLQKLKKSYKSIADYYKPISKIKDKIDKRVIESDVFKLKGKVIIYNNIVATLSNEGGRFVGSEVISDHLSSSFKSIFDIIWHMTTKKDRVSEF